MRTTIIVVPTYNEAENIVELAERVCTAASDVHLLVVDDSSPDGTADLAERTFAGDPRFARYSVLRRTGPRGLGIAYREGFRVALARGFDRVVQMDADLSHDPAYLPAIFRAAANCDLVIGSRYCPGGGVRNWPRRRIMLSRFAVAYVRAIAGIPIADSTAGFRCWSREALNTIEIDTLRSDGYSFQVELSHRAVRSGIPIAEVPIIFTDRRFGRSKISRAVLIESFLTPWRLRRHPWQPGAVVVVGSGNNR